MKKNLTEMVFILDRSGSMWNLVNDTIGGFNSMIEEQKKEPGDAFVSTVLFDNHYEMLHNHVDIKDVAPITSKEYYTRGSTALLDALGKTINSVGRRLSDTPEDERPEKVMFVIITDGMENSSTEFSREHIKQMIEHQQDKYSWVFMFIGANMDAIAEAGNLGIDPIFSKTYTASAVGTQSVYSAVSKTVATARGVDSDDYWAIKSACCLDSIV